MGLREERTFTVEEFHDWHERQEASYELVDGRAVMMTGGTNRHAFAISNIAAALRPQVRAGCNVTTSDLAVRTGETQLRYPDVIVDCGPVDLDGYDAANPVVVVEVLSRSTEVFDATGKLEEYKRVPSVRVVLHVSPRTVTVDCYCRGDAGWNHQRFTDLDDVVELPEIHARLALGDIYEGLNPEPSPHLRVVD